MSNLETIDQLTKDFFGEENVDITSPLDVCVTNSLCSATTHCIMIRFPIVHIINENGDHHTIKDLYILLQFDDHGRLRDRFLVQRSTYDINEVYADYAHSHIPGMNFSDPAYMLTPCTGSGPINGTIALLNNEFDEDTYLIFLRELQQWTQVESLAGVPYRRMNDIGTRRSNGSYQLWSPMDHHDVVHPLNSFYTQLYKKCIDHHVFRFVVINGQLEFADSFYKLMFIISNIARADNDIWEACTRREVIVKHGTIYSAGSRSASRSHNEIRSFCGSHMFKFKGEYVYPSVDERIEQQDAGVYTIVNEAFPVIKYALSRANEIYVEQLKKSTK